MKTFFKNLFTISGIIALVAIVIWCFLNFVFPKPSLDEVPTIISRDIGNVTSITNCDKSGKYDLYCNFTFDNNAVYKLDVTDFPSNYIYVGDNIVFQRRVFEKSYTTYKCQNGQCQSQGVCYFSMPCWNKKNTQY